MNKLSISTLTANSVGNIIISATFSSKLMDSTARISRVKTLDGGVSIIHSGFSDGDRTLFIKSRLSKTKIAVLNTIYKNETFVLASFFDGVFLVVIDRMNTTNGKLDMTILIKTREA